MYDFTCQKLEKTSDITSRKCLMDGKRDRPYFIGHLPLPPGVQHSAKMDVSYFAFVNLDKVSEKISKYVCWTIGQ